jgi:hypothetical protein
MSEEIQQEKCQQRNTIEKMICDVTKLYKEDFDKWKECYKELVKAVFTKNDSSYKINKENLDSLKNKLKVYPLFENLKDGTNVFSFIVMLNKYGEKSRKEIAKKILNNKECETDFFGVPAGQQGISVKSFENLENAKLNQIAYKLINGSDVSEDDLEVGKNLTDTFKNVFYILAPEKYYPSDSNTRAFLKKIGQEEEEPLKISITEGNYFSRAVSFLAPMQKNQVDNILNKFIKKDENKPKNIILTGIPGTGKTYAVMKYLEDNGFKDENRFEFVQFHPSYDYEDFIEGLKPIPSENGQIKFKLVNGVFKELCKKAYEDEEKKTYVMVIDEINRANLSRVFGELLYCLEYRDAFVSTKMTTYIESLVKEEEQELYSVSKEHIGKFAIPNNLIILGTMNEVDRSIDAFDLALRRRFIWEEIGFSETALLLYEDFFTKGFQEHIQGLISKAKKLNDTLKKDIGVNYQLGHTYYFKIIDYFEKESDTKTYESALCNLWEYHLQSILKEYIKVKFSESDIEKKLKEYKEIIVGKNDCNE